jgi:hypothetical protein
VKVGHILFVTYVEFEENEHSVVVSRIDAKTGTVTSTAKIGTGGSNHAGACLVIDGSGRLHAFYGAHGTPLKYRYTLAPGDISGWSSEQLIGEQLTYPSAVVLPSDEILVTARQGNSSINILAAPASLVFMRFQNGVFLETQTLFVSNQQDEQFHDRYADYQPQLSVGRDGRVYVAFHIHERPKGNPLGDDSGFGYAISYLYSDDGGRVWKDDVGRAVSLPATLPSLHLLAGARNVSDAKAYYAGTSPAINPITQEYFVLYEKYQLAEGRWETWLNRRGPTGWTESLVGRDLFHSSMMFTRDGTIYVISEKGTNVMFQPPQASWYLPKRIVLFKSDDLGRSFTTREVSGYPEGGDTFWLPSLEKAITVSGLTAPLFSLYTGAANDITSNNHSNSTVFLVQVR